MLSRAMALYLIRHGETEANAARVLQRPDVPLSERGVAQAQRLAARLAGEGLVRILSSDLARAAMTAEALRAASGAPVVYDPLLQERNFGDLRGTPYAELGVDPFAEGYAPPGGESWERFHARVDDAWKRIQELATQTEGNLAVVTHGLVCHSLATRVLTLAEGMDPARGGWPNTCLTIVDGPDPWRVRLLACVAHLGGRESGARPGGRA